MPKVSPQYIEARRQEILDAAVSCFAHNGFHKTTMQDIFLEAEMSAGAIYRYFSSKEEIIGALCQAFGERERAWLTEALSNESPAGSLYDLADKYFRSLADPGTRNLAGMWVEVWAEAARRSGVEGSVGDPLEVLEHIGEVIAALQESGDVNPALEPRSVARLLVSSYQGLILQLAVGHDVNIDAYQRSLEAMIFGDFWRSKPLSAG